VGIKDFTYPSFSLYLAAAACKRQRHKDKERVEHFATRIHKSERKTLKLK
jgi:hypothetical protein